MISGDMMQPPSIDALVQRAREGDKEAWNALLRHYQPQLDAWAHERIQRFAPNGLRASDITQEASLKAYRSLKTFRGSNAAMLGGWLKTIVRTAWLDLIGIDMPGPEGYVAHVPLESPEVKKLAAIQHTPSQFAAQQESGRQVIAALTQLTLEQREVLTADLLLGTSKEELMARSGRSAEAHDSLLGRGIRKLEDHIQGKAEGKPLEPHESRIRNQKDVALSRYFRGLKKGVPVDPEVFAKDYPECVAELLPLLRLLEAVRALTPDA